MFFNSKKRQERREEKRKNNIIQEVVKNDPTFQERLNRYMEIVRDSMDLMSNTKKLSTLIGRRTDAKSSALRLEEMFLRIEDDCCNGVQEEIDALFVERLPVVLEAELEVASNLKTVAGRRKRWNGIVQELERCDRLDGDIVDSAILEAEERVFLLLEEGTEWSGEPETAEFSLTEDFLVQKVKDAARKKGKEMGLSPEEVDSAIRDAFKQ